MKPIEAAGEDASQLPPVPARFHNLVAARREPGTVAIGLHPLLPTPPRSWLGTPELESLNRWMASVAGGELAVRPEPVRRRMLEIFGIDKPRRRHAAHLDLFPDWLKGAQTLLNLWPYAHPSGSWVTGQPGKTVLMVENAETFCVLCQVLRESPVRQIGEVVFGSGNALARPSAVEPKRILYYGDWDLDGLGSLLRLAAEDPRVEPWSAAYWRLLEFAPVRDFRPRSRRLNRSALAAVLPGDLLAAALELQQTPRSIPQEWLGLDEMRRLCLGLQDD
ncbi:MAG: DUF2220 family protein [Myxococcales bacterium]